MTYTPRYPTAATELGALAGDNFTDAERVLRLWRPYAESAATPTGLLRAPAAIARLDAGRWLCDCPFGCGNAQLAPWHDRRFFCIKCANNGAGKWLPVAWLDDDLVEAAELLMSYRPPRGLYFNPARETVGDLATENDFQGYPSDLPVRLEQKITRPPNPSRVDDAARPSRLRAGHTTKMGI